MPEAYAPVDLMSTDNVSPGRWRAGLFALAGTVGAGAILVIALSLGAADPPRAGPLAWQTGSAYGWQLKQRVGEFDLYQSPILLPPQTFTIEISAANHGTLDSAWGVWLEDEDGIHTILINNEGYLSVSSDAIPHWTEFLHVRADANTLYVNVEDDATATARINDEIAWTGVILSATDWGIARYRTPDLTWSSLSLYAP